jgi:hypothetical protein
MRDLALSMMRLPLDLSLAGMEQMSRLMAPRRGDTTDAAGGSDLLSQVGNLAFELLQTGMTTVYWVTGTVWQQTEGASGWGPVPPPAGKDPQP